MGNSWQKCIGQCIGVLLTLETKRLMHASPSPPNCIMMLGRPTRMPACVYSGLQYRTDGTLIRRCEPPLPPSPLFRLPRRAEYDNTRFRLSVSRRSCKPLVKATNIFLCRVNTARAAVSQGMSDNVVRCVCLIFHASSPLGTI